MSTAEPSEPEEFGPYVVYERLGLGGMATVHRAKKRGIAGYERGVALKRLLPHIADDLEFIQSFVREAKLASLLTHPNIAQIYEFGRVGAIYYIAMEHVDGIDVRKILRYARRSGETVPLPVVLSILVELCEALEYAHTFVDEEGEHQGIIHRDVSPSNLIVANSGHLKVIDFGIAKASTRQHHTESGRVKGKLGYMSPEAAAGKIYGPASDVFSAGVVAYELLTTHPLFSSKTDYETLLKIHHAEISLPSQLNPACTPALDAVVAAALARVPEERTQSAAEFRFGLEEVANQAGFRLSSREVYDWLAGVDNQALRSLSRSQQQRAASTSQLRPLPLPPPPQEPRGPSGRLTSIAHAAALADQGRAPGLGGGWVELRRSSTDDDLIADLAWGGDPGTPSLRHPIAGSSAVQPSPLGSAPGHFLLSGSSAGVNTGAGSEQTFGAPFSTSPSARPNRWRVRLVGATLLAVAATVGFLVMRARRTPPPTSAVLNFAVQPADSIIEMGGHEVSRASPYQMTIAPGMYSIAIRHDGYLPWSSNVTIRGGESQAIQVALERTKEVDPATAIPAPVPVVGVAPSPPPAAVDPAASVSATKDRSGERSTLRPAAVRVDRPANRGRPDRAERALPVDPVKTARDPESLRADLGSIGRNGTEEGKGSKGAVREPIAPPQTVAPIAPVQAVTSPTASPSALPVTKIPAAPARVPVVAASEVTKISGTVPAIRSRGSNDSFGNVLAKLCIDDQGRVTSARTLRAAPEIASVVQESLKTWRYKPYLAQGKPAPVCFPMQMRVIVLPSN
jgi:eukaryotic-like serine/threonine-protein kinase